jgi:SAM-dependent methyltransferase
LTSNATIVDLPAYSTTSSEAEFGFTTYNYVDGGWSTSIRVQNPEVWRQPFYPDFAFADPLPWVVSSSLSKTVTLSVPFNIEPSGNYQVWARVFVGPLTLGSDAYVYDPGELSFVVDGSTTFGFRWETHGIGHFVWAYLGSTSLGAGSHSLSIANHRGLAVVSKVAFARVPDLANAREWIRGSIAGGAKGVLYVHKEPVLPQITELEFLAADKQQPPWVFQNSANFPGYSGSGWASVANSSVPLLVPFYAPETGNYTFFVRGFVAGDGGSAAYNIDNYTMRTVDWRNRSSSWTLSRIGNAVLVQGMHTLGVHEVGKNLSGVDLGTLRQDAFVFVPSRYAGEALQLLSVREAIVENASYGLAFQARAPNPRISFEANLMQSTNYTLMLSSGSSDFRNTTVLIDGQPVGLTFPDQSDLTHAVFGPIFMASGTHSIVVNSSRNQLTIDQLLLFSSAVFFNQWVAQRSSSIAVTAGRNPADQQLSTPQNSTAKVLVSLTSYHPLWRITGDGVNSASLPVYSSGNVFILGTSERGLQLRLVFGPQDFWVLGVAVTVGTATGLTGWFVLVTFVTARRRRAGKAAPRQRMDSVYDENYFATRCRGQEDALPRYLVNILTSMVKGIVGPQTEPVVLDLGSGLGAYVRFYQGLGCMAIGMDSSAYAARLSKQMIASVTHMPIKSGTVDLALAVHVIEHLKPNETWKFLRECRRVLKASGRLFIITPNGLSPIRVLQGKRWFQDPTHVNIQNPVSLVASLRKAGFTMTRFTFPVPVRNKSGFDGKDFVFALLSRTFLGYFRNAIHLVASPAS